ncbi:MAG: SGNH/GDSL hydrolase family protein [Planctomycetota bacterium]
MRLIPGFLIAVLFFVSPATALDWPGESSDWKGYTRYNFEVDGRKAFVTEPEHAAPGNPWVWRARFPGYHAEIDEVLLARGFHVAFIDTNGMLGSPAAMKHWDAFYKEMTARGLAKKPALYGVSRGGLFVYGFAGRWPERVACVYADTPVLDIKSWPLGQGAGKGHAVTWERLLEEYNFTEARALAYRLNPVDTFGPIAKAKLPLMHIVSLNDAVVPPTENTFVLRKRLAPLGHGMTVIEVKEGTEKSSGHHFDHPAVTRAADFIERHASVTPDPADYFVMRGSLQNSRLKFDREKRGRVAFVGGSITQNPGWRTMTMQYLQDRFPETEFEFIGAGIASTGSIAGAFRLERDVLRQGDIDLLFEEAAVNDVAIGHNPTGMRRGMEGVVRHARLSGATTDVVVMHFVDPAKMETYRAGVTPKVITIHESVAAHYQAPTLHLAREVTDRIDAGQFTWEGDFKNLHPSPYGQRLYASSIRRLLSAAWEGDAPKAIAKHKTPEPLDPFSYDGGKILPVNAAKSTGGFIVIKDCDPTANGVGGRTRAGFADVDMLVGDTPGDSFTLEFSGRAVGLFVSAGPDAGQIRHRVDGGEWQTFDLFTRHSPKLHLPRAYVLQDGLAPGAHTLVVEILATRNEQSKGTACRIVGLLVNE